MICFCVFSPEACRNLGGPSQPSRAPGSKRRALGRGSRSPRGLLHRPQPSCPVPFLGPCSKPCSLDVDGFPIPPKAFSSFKSCFLPDLFQPVFLGTLRRTSSLPLLSSWRAVYFHVESGEWPCQSVSAEVPGGESDIICTPVYHCGLLRTPPGVRRLLVPRARVCSLPALCRTVLGSESGAGHGHSACRRISVIGLSSAWPG